MSSLIWIASILLASLALVSDIILSDFVSVFPSARIVPALSIDDNSNHSYAPSSSTHCLVPTASPTSTWTAPRHTDSGQGSISQIHMAARAVGRTLVDVEGDGNCFFRAVADQIGVPQVEHQTIRTGAVEVLEQTTTDWWGATSTFDTPAEYLEQVQQVGWQADNIEIRATAIYLGRNIVIMRPDGQETLINIADYMGTPYDIAVTRAGVVTTVTTGTAPIGPTLWIGYIPEVPGVSDGHYVSLPPSEFMEVADAVLDADSGDEYASAFGEDDASDGELDVSGSTPLPIPALLHQQIDDLLVADRPDRQSTDTCTPKEMGKVLSMLRDWISTVDIPVPEREKLQARLRAVRKRVDMEPLRTALHQLCAECFDDVALLQLLVAGLDSTGLEILGADIAPTESDFARLPLSYRDRSWGVYCKLLVRQGKRPALYVGSTNKLPCPGRIGGFHDRAMEHRKYLVGKNDFFNNLARKHAREQVGGSVTLDAGKHFDMSVRPIWRLSPHELPQRRSGVAQGVQLSTRYMEALLHEWLDSFSDPHATVWRERLHQGTNGESPVVQGIKNLAAYTPEEQRARNKAAANTKYQQLDDVARRAFIDRGARRQSKEQISVKNAKRREKRKAEELELSDDARQARQEKGRQVSKIACANWKAELKLDAPRLELQKFKARLTRIRKELGPEREDEAMWRCCHPNWKQDRMVYTPGAGEAAKKPDLFVNPPPRKRQRNYGRYKYGPSSQVSTKDVVAVAPKDTDVKPAAARPPLKPLVNHAPAETSTVDTPEQKKGDPDEAQEARGNANEKPRG